MENRNFNQSDSYKYVRTSASENGNQLSDDELLDLVAKGNKRAFGALYERYIDAIYRYVLFQVGGNEVDAEDVTEEVFLRAFKMVLKKRKKNSNFKALIYRIAHNLVIDRYRTRKSLVSLEQVEELKDTNPHPESWVQNSELSEDLVAAIKELKPKMQKVIILRFIVGADTSETADIMGISEGYVRVLQYRALQELKTSV
jgi:RNA polymerase sigma-70 factor (ECF subfamily)